MSDVLDVTEKQEVIEVQQQSITSELATSMLQTLKRMKESKGSIQTNAEYYKFAKEGDSVEGVFIGLQKVYFKDDQAEGGYTPEQDAVKWMSEENGQVKIYLAAGAALVNEFKKNSIQQGTGVVITYTGLGGENKKTKLFNLAIKAC